MIEAKVILDSLAPSGVRLTTFVLTFPRFILPEFNTHRMFSRNASSSRAIPVSKQIETVKNMPFVPKAFNVNARGMQGGEAVSQEDQQLASQEWLLARDKAVESAERLLSMGIAKQYVNRLLEPFTWTSVVCTATDYDNFFALRCHPMAQPEIHELADKMYEAYQASIPKLLFVNDWHLPFITGDDFRGVFDSIVSNDTLEALHEQLIRSSVARCARVSYLNHEGKKPSFGDDNQLYDRLLGQLPIHASPAEHQACASQDKDLRSGNFRGWIQYRKTLAYENIVKFEGK